METNLKELKERVERLYNDVKDTEKALEDRKIDYITKREYQNDLVYDHMKINEYEAEIRKLESENTETPKVLIKKIK